MPKETGRPSTPELRHPVPHARIILEGSRSFVPYRPGLKPDASFHVVPFNPAWASMTEAERPRLATWPKALCPTCRGMIGRRYGRAGEAFFATDESAVSLPIYQELEPCPECLDRLGAHITYCLWCQGLSPRNEARLASQLRETRLFAQESAARERAAQAAKVEDDAWTDQLDRILAGRRQDRGKAVLTELERRAIWNGYLPAVHRPAITPPVPAQVGRRWLKEIGQEPDFSLELDERGRTVSVRAEPGGLMFDVVRTED
jgi:hypothetical protein